MRQSSLPQVLGLNRTNSLGHSSSSSEDSFELRLKQETVIEEPLEFEQEIIMPKLQINLSTKPRASLLTNFHQEA